MTISKAKSPTNNLREEVSRQFTMREILDKKDSDPLGLLDAESEVRAFDSRDSTAYSVLFPRRSFLGREFIDLLFRTRPPPVDFPQGSFGILADWDILKSSNSSARNRDLVSLHQGSLEPYWSEFAQHHYQPFRQALVENPKGESAFENLSRYIVTRRQAIERLGYFIRQENGQRPPQLSVRSLIRMYFETNNQHISRSKLKGMGKQRQDYLLRQMLENPPAELIKRLLKIGILGSYRFFVDIEEPDNSFYIGSPQSSRVYGYSIEPLDNGIFRISHKNSWITVAFDQDRFVEADRFIGDPDNSLLPWLVWTKSKKTGERNYISSEVPPVLSAGVSSRANPLVGLVAAAYLSPEQRSRLPHELGLKGGRYKQVMREAQVPLLVSIYRKRILEGAVFQAVEDSVPLKSHGKFYYLVQGLIRRN